MSVTHYAVQLSRRPAARGHEVLHTYCGSKPQGSLSDVLAILMGTVPSQMAYVRVMARGAASL